MFAASALVDSGLLVRLALSPSSLKPEMLESGRLTLSILVMAAIYIPVSHNVLVCASSQRMASSAFA